MNTINKQRKRAQRKVTKSKIELVHGIRERISTRPILTSENYFTMLDGTLHVLSWPKFSTFRFFMILSTVEVHWISKCIFQALQTLSSGSRMEIFDNDHFIHPRANTTLVSWWNRFTYTRSCLYHRTAFLWDMVTKHFFISYHCILKPISEAWNCT